MWRIVFARADRLSLGFRRAISSMNYEMLGVDSRRSRWRECLDYVKDQFGEALELLFARERLPMQEELKVGFTVGTYPGVVAPAGLAWVLMYHYWALFI